MSTALVLGGAATVWADVEAALQLGEYHGVVSCNDVTAEWPGQLDACASLHPSSWRRWLGTREKRGHSAPARIFGHLESEGARDIMAGVEHIQFRFPGQEASGSSGLFALKVALIDLGFDKAVLCGIPMTNEGRHFFDPKEWRGAQAHRKGWQQALPEIADRARSMSGWTKTLLGEPTEGWLGA